jgi:carboxypeptidase PM20D1
VADPRVRLRREGAFASEASRVSSPEAPAFRQLQRTIREVFPGAVVAPYLLMGGTDARQYEVIARDIYRFTPMRLRAGDQARMHGTDERIPVEAYREAIRFYRQLVLDAAGP